MLICKDLRILRILWYYDVKLRMHTNLSDFLGLWIMANDSHSGKAAGHHQLCRNDLRVLVLSDDAPACVTLDALTAEEYPLTSIGFTKKRF